MVMIDGVSSATCLGPVCFSTKHELENSRSGLDINQPNLYEWGSLTLRLISTSAYAIYDNLTTFTVPTRSTVALYLLAAFGMAAALQKAMLIIKGRHRTLLEQKTEAKAETTTIVNLNNTVRVEPAARTSSDIPDHQPKQDKARPDPSDQYGVLTRQQGVKEPLEDYCNEVRRVRNIFTSDDMIKYIFVRGLADEILRK